MEKQTGIGVVGCGAISGAYFEGAKNFPFLKMLACADLNPGAARSRGREYGVACCQVDELLANPAIDIVLNLTVPKAHAAVTVDALKAGKHVYLEKPLAVSRDEGARIMQASRQAGRRVGCAPDTFLGSGIQTARHAIDSGLIGKPVAFTAMMMGSGHESWHPSPEFYYEAGGGPMFDMGPYYLTALLNFFGPVRRIMGLASIAMPERTITSAPKFGKKIAVETPDHVTGCMEFANGVVGTIIQSFATANPPYAASPIVVYGTEATLQVPDPNRFSEAVMIRGRNEGEWKTLPPLFAHDYSRSVGLADMALALRELRPHRASMEQAFAVLDLMQGFLESSEIGMAKAPASSYERPAPLLGAGSFEVLD